MTHAASRIAALALGLCVALPAATQDRGSPASKKLYCWNQGGTRVCSDALPPEQAGAARTEISARSGRATGQVDRALNAEERAAARSAADSTRMAADAEAARVRRDLAMVASYASEADLRRAFGERIVLVDESIKTSLMSEGNLRRGLVVLLQQAADLELAGKPVNKRLQDEVLARRGELTRQLEIMVQQRADRAALGSDLESALERYRAIKQTPPGGVAAATDPDAG